MRDIIKLIALCLLPQLTISSIIRTGTCDPNVRGLSGFSKASYLGQWYEYSNVFEVYEDLPFVGRCVRATYTDTGDTIGVNNEFVSPVTGYGNAEGSARFANPNDPLQRGELIVSFGGFGRKKRSALAINGTFYEAVTPVVSQQAQERLGFGGGNRPNYSVIATDYTSYAVVYMCSQFLPFVRKESLWLLTRAQIPSVSTVHQGLKVMQTYGLPYRNLVRTQQTGCSLLPGSST